MLIIIIPETRSVSANDMWIQFTARKESVLNISLDNISTLYIYIMVLHYIPLANQRAVFIVSFNDSMRWWNGGSWMLLLPQPPCVAVCGDLAGQAGLAGFKNIIWIEVILTKIIFYAETKLFWRWYLSNLGAERGHYNIPYISKL